MCLSKWFLKLSGKISLAAGDSWWGDATSVTICDVKNKLDVKMWFQKPPQKKEKRKSYSESLTSQQIPLEKVFRHSIGSKTDSLRQKTIAKPRLRKLSEIEEDSGLFGSMIVHIPKTRWSLSDSELQDGRSHVSSATSSRKRLAWKRLMFAGEKQKSKKVTADLNVPGCLPETSSPPSNPVSSSESTKLQKSKQTMEYVTQQASNPVTSPSISNPVSYDEIHISFKPESTPSKHGTDS